MVSLKRKRLLAAFDISLKRIVQLSGAIGAMAAAVILYFFQLGSFIGLSASESAAIVVNRSMRAISNAPLNVPYQLLDWLFLHLPVGSEALRGRLASAVMALVCGLLFYLVVRRWYGLRTAILSTALFVPSGWLLHTGRYGTGLIMLTAMVLGLVAAASWINSGKERTWMLPTYAIICGFALLVPGGLWFVLVTTVVLRKRLVALSKAASRGQLIAVAGLAVSGFGSLIGGLFLRPEQARLWLGLPAQLPELSVIAKQAVGSVSYLVARGPFLPDFWLAHTPALDIAATVLLLLGVLFYSRHRNNARVHLIALFSLVSVALIALNGAAAVSYIVPLVYLTVATGLAYLLHQWFGVFPNNPFARFLALFLVSVLISCAGVYHAQRYFIAWRNSPDTIQARIAP